MTADTQIAKIFEWRRGFNAMHLIDLGVRLGLFRAFAEMPGATSRDIAERLGLHPPYVEVWCMTAYGFELLDADEDHRFRLAPFMESILANPSHPRYLGGYVRLGTEFATDDFRRCLDAFHTGGTVPFQGRSETFAHLVAESTGGLHLVTARRILPELPGLKARLDEGGMILEVGCGTGNLLIQLAKAFPRSCCVGVDIDPISLTVARAAIRAAGVTDRVEIVEGEVGSMAWRASFDVAIMIEVLHEIAPALRQAVMNGCAQALRPGGWLVIIDETYPSTLAQARQPEFRFPLQTGFEELIWGNIIPTRQEQQRLLRQAGFAGEIHRALLGEGFTLLSTQRQ
jgi:ubiquinone/menaquinone biosynthesis C-methylase UbiE